MKTETIDHKANEVLGITLSKDTFGDGAVLYNVFVSYDESDFAMERDFKDLDEAKKHFTALWTELSEFQRLG